MIPGAESTVREWRGDAKRPGETWVIDRESGAARVAMRGQALAACICNGSGREIPDLLQQEENNRAQHHECNDFHGDPPSCAGVARREGWAGIVAVRLLRRGFATNVAIACDESRSHEVITKTSYP